LKEGFPNSSWLDIRLCHEYVKSSFQIQVVSHEPPVLWDSDFSGPLTFDINAPVLSATGRVDDAQPVRVPLHHCLVQDDRLRSPPFAAEGPIFSMGINLSTAAEPIWLHATEGVFRLRSWSFKIFARKNSRKIPLKFARWTYTQEFHDSALAWIASTQLELSEGMKELRLMFIPDDDGFLRVVGDFLADSTVRGRGLHPET
jgi:hypothetical protein